ncbi:SMP-30/gluconolactonase/LRE family protein [Nonomuraea angiospora]|uniref:SMP-30/gluconolactonase/LRE family protein n=1 Tax=Nonomuraea angiospora TaxID=46172 RepID=UPI00298EE09B|nr:SMP-30/gluconolactonase/LRE family protein [Nonomuraea angiospora]
MILDQVTGPAAFHGEGPVWSQEWGGLRWVDMLAGDVLSLDGETGTVEREHVGAVAAAVRPRAGGGMVVGVEKGFLLMDGSGGRAEVPAPIADGVRMNEGGCDPYGRFLCGSMGYDAEPGRGALYRLGRDLMVETILPKVTISNGVAWSPDGRIMYYVDTPTSRIDAFDYDVTGAVSGRRVVTHVTGGGPDGLTVDAEGCLWVALWGGSAVHRYGPDGAFLGRVEVPVAQVTACTFGGPDLDELFITTSRYGLAEPEPEAGAVFREKVGVPGLPTVAFAG